MPTFDPPAPRHSRAITNLILRAMGLEGYAVRSATLRTGIQEPPTVVVEFLMDEAQAARLARLIEPPTGSSNEKS